MEVSDQIHPFGHFTPAERAPGTHWIGGLTGPRAGLDEVEKRKKNPSLLPPGMLPSMATE